MDTTNIILINCDDLGYGDLGCYGSSRNKTPNIDKLAQEGIRFTDFYMASPVCSPSRGAMMTGCFPPRIGFDLFEGKHVLFPGDATGLNPEELTVPKMLKEAGYTTKIVGKWHCGDQPEFLPLNHGFDEYFGLPYSNDMGRQVGREDSCPLPLMNDNSVLMQQPDQAHLTERYAEECIRFIRENRESPFFLYLAHMYVHVPLYVPKRFLEASKNGAYGAAVESIDWVTGVIMHELRELGLSDDTMIIFTSDNGSRARDEGGSNQPLRGTKATTWEGGQRVPCILKWPKRIPSGSESNQMVSSIDFLPTLSSIIGITRDDEIKIDGKDISSILLNPDTSATPHASFPYYMGDRLEAIRSGDWKLHFYKDNRKVNLLFNLECDAGETNNIFDDNPEKVSELQSLAHYWRQELGDSVMNISGKARREPGKVDNPQTLTQYDPSHPYIVAMYDTADSKVMAG